MRLVCPQCMSNVTVPDNTAGKEATCPNCGKSFPTPARYTATVSELGTAAVPPPGLAPPIPVLPVIPPVPPAPPGLVSPPTGGFLPGPANIDAPTGYTKSRGITISPTVVAWLPAALLTAVLLLTFFPWVGSYAGNSAVYSQRPWGALFSGTPSRNFRLEQANLIPGGWIDKTHSDWLLLPFFLCLLTGLAFAWAERAMKPPGLSAPPPLVKLWPWRNSIVAGCAALALIFLLWQLANGFGMERAIKQHIAEQFSQRRAEAADSPGKLEALEYEEAQELRKYDIERTTWLCLALMCNVLAVCAVVTRVALDNRGNKPPPKLLLHY
ncbi:zinc-ribbon domain-containing protein [Gemmata sp. JC673]|uniref:Zinc-ribbon domain-containing protein n=1 Tax=Gemmata algarum TaxID=2975278 RepID=A0ABU5F7B2_9BACT|nr:hypothetical protein [Gemmata algarum]MDY3562213.1 zinc-ribbon domain-containing protein [Gemmata algarum]